MRFQIYFKLPVLAIIILLILLINSCEIQKKTKYRIWKDGSIFSEKFDKKYFNENKYTENNVIFTVGRTFIFDYYYENILGQRYLFNKNKSLWEDPFGRAYDFSIIKDTILQTITEIRIKAIWGLGPFKLDSPPYDQTVINIQYYNNQKQILIDEHTGAIENEKNLWIHPPRCGIFRILELNPFPFIQFPYKIGNKWQDSIIVPNSYADKKWKEWEGFITCTSSYEIIDIKEMNTSLGIFKCYVIKSSANSELGKSELISYYNPKLGFIRLDYINIDNTKIVLELKRIE